MKPSQKCSETSVLAILIIEKYFRKVLPTYFDAFEKSISIKKNLKKKKKLRKRCQKRYFRAKENKPPTPPKTVLKSFLGHFEGKSFFEIFRENIFFVDFFS